MAIFISTLFSTSSLSSFLYWTVVNTSTNTPRIILRLTINRSLWDKMSLFLWFVLFYVKRCYHTTARHRTKAFYSASLFFVQIQSKTESELMDERKVLLSFFFLIRKIVQTSNLYRIRCGERAGERERVKERNMFLLFCVGTKFVNEMAMDCISDTINAFENH